MATYIPGQRWLSEPEPELGLGIITELDGRHCVVFFPCGGETRRYLSASAPLRRIRFRTGDELTTADGRQFTVTRVTEEDDILTYHGDGVQAVETLLADRVVTDSPEERLRVGHVDSSAAYALRRDLWRFWSAWLRSPARGVMGGRIQLLGHQLSIAQEVIGRQRPRVLLADEPGLGKTIEACLILHHALMVGRVKRVLVLVPESLQHQWFVELIRRFQMIFRVVDAAHCKAMAASDPQANPFEEDAFVVTSLPFLMENRRRGVEAVSAQWDMLVVDEAHHIAEGSPAGDLLQALAHKIPDVLLLTATPEQLGARSHFSRLHLLDPQRYSDFEEYERSHEHYQALADVAARLLNTDAAFALAAPQRAYWKSRDPALLDRIDQLTEQGEEGRHACVRDLLDRFGPGRVIFRNTRQAVAGFPEREVLLTPLTAAGTTNAADDPRLSWLLGWLEEHSEDKALLICASLKTAQMVESFLRSSSHVPLAVFHEGLTLIQRDRNAAWFAEPDGARLLVTSEIGGEGRNFQSARHLILFDLPRDPELLEQRIGRLDRIGQAPKIFIHVPYVARTAQEVLARWYHEGMGAFARPRAGGSMMLETFDDRLAALETRFDEETLRGLLEETSAHQEELQRIQDQGRNRLLEWGSFHAEAVHALLEAIAATERNENLWALVHRLFDALGVDVDPLTLDTWRLAPGPRLHPAFPWLKGDSRLASFNRERALQRDTTVFLSPDHPMISESVDLLLGSHEGNVSVVGCPSSTPGAHLDCVFLLQAVAPGALRVQRFLPPSPVELTLDQLGVPLGERVVDEPWQDVPPEFLERQPAIVEHLVPSLLKTARKAAEKEATRLRKAAADTARRHYDAEVDRLRHLHTVEAVSPAEIEAMEEEARAVLDAIASARLSLDALQLRLLGLPVS